MNQKILFLIGHIGIGGKERQLMEMILGLPNSRYELFLFRKSANDLIFNKIDTKIKEIKTLNVKSFNIYNIIQLYKFINKIEPHIIFSLSKTTSHFSMIIKFLFQKRFRLINASIRNAPVIFNFYLRIEKMLYKFYDEVIANSYAGLLAYKQLGINGRYILYNGFDMNRVPSDSKIKLRLNLGLGDKFLVTMVASMGDRKDQTSLIKAANILLRKNSDILFYLIGDGPKRSHYLNLIKHFDLNDQVKILGEIENVESYLKASDLSVLCSAKSHGEGIPNVIIESFACGTPVIATDNGGTKEILRNDLNGYLINNGDYKNLADKILFLKNNPIRLKSFAQNCLSIIEDRFRTENMIMNFEKIILTE